MKDSHKATNNKLLAVLAAAAVTGLMAGAAQAANPQAGEDPSFRADKAKNEAGKSVPAKKKYKHMCTGKNECKGKGGCKTGDQGCRGKNTCKGKGGCAVLEE